MKAALAVLFLSFPLLAQNQTPKTLAACGDLNLDLAVDLDKSPQGPVAPQPDKALVYLIQQADLTFNFTYPTTTVGVDGKWIGENKKSSYFSFFVSPGEHHLCEALEFALVHSIELSHFTAEAGKVYYFRTRINWGRDAPQNLSVDRVDSDEGEYLIGRYPLAKLRMAKGKTKPPGSSGASALDR